MEEEWREIPGYEGYYEVSNMGRVRSLDRYVKGKGGYPCFKRGKVLSPRLLGPKQGNRYLSVTLTNDGKGKHYFVHRLVLFAFVGPQPTPEHQARHLNGDRYDNRPENLLWGTISENNLDRVKHGTHTQASTTHCPRGHELKDPNVYYRKDEIGRECLACRRAKALRLLHKKKYGVEYDLEELCDEYHRKIMKGSN